MTDADEVTNVGISDTSMNDARDSEGITASNGSSEDITTGSSSSDVITADGSSSDVITADTGTADHSSSSYGVATLFDCSSQTDDILSAPKIQDNNSISSDDKSPTNKPTRTDSKSTSTTASISSKFPYSGLNFKLGNLLMSIRR